MIHYDEIYTINDWKRVMKEEDITSEWTEDYKRKKKRSNKNIARYY